MVDRRSLAFGGIRKARLVVGRRRRRTGCRQNGVDFVTWLSSVPHRGPCLDVFFTSDYSPTYNRSQLVYI